MVSRIATIPFLSAVPLVDYFSTKPGAGVDITTVLPCEIGGLLFEDEVDVALLPVVEYFRGVGAGVVPGIGIAAGGRIESVKLFTRVNVAAVGRVAVDRGSPTAVALLRILLAEFYDIRPDLLVVEPHPETLLDTVEAALVVGDRCFAVEKYLREAGRNEVQAFDLGEMWHKLTGLPFVFATWAFGAGFIERSDEAQQRQVVNLLTRARDRGLANLDEIVAGEAAAGRLGPGGVEGAAGLRRYFETSLTYVLGEREMEGLHRFHELCIRHAICSTGRAPRLALTQAE